MIYILYIVSILTYPNNIIASVNFKSHDIYYVIKGDMLSKTFLVTHINSKC